MLQRRGGLSNSVLGVWRCPLVIDNEIVPRFLFIYIHKMFQCRDARNTELFRMNKVFCIFLLAVMVSVSGHSQSRFDVNGDGQEDMTDVTELINHILGKDDSTQFTVNGVTFEMVSVGGGTFTIGATPEQGSDAYDDEKPAHSVMLSSYSIGKTEVTQALWEAVMGSNPSYFKGDNLPVENVSWEDCQEFISKLNTLTGQNFRLPTEAEWEYAASGGNKSCGYKYSGSNSCSAVAWYFDNSGRKTNPVGTKAPNELGIFDMTGNVEEWCSDWSGSYSSSAQTNPTGPDTGSVRVCRGGSYLRVARSCRVSHRTGNNPSNHLNGLGLRLVR